MHPSNHYEKIYCHLFPQISFHRPWRAYSNMMTFIIFLSAVFLGDCLHNHVLSSDSNPTVCMSGQNSRKLRGVIEVADFAVSFIPLVCGIINKKELKFSQNSNNYAKSKQYSKICLPGNQRHIRVCFIKTWNFKNRVRMSSSILLAII